MSGRYQLKTHRAVVAAVAVALVATGCGSSGGAAAPRPTAPAVTVGSPSSTVVPASTAPTEAGGRPSVEQPCSFITAAEMSEILGASATVQDEGFRCKYLVGDGWLQVELMEFSSASAAEIWDYDKTHGTAAAGVGDEAYIFGAAIVAKLGDVFLAVDGNNLPQPADDATLTAIATTILTQIG
jgi:hypothetical protein